MSAPEIGAEGATFRFSLHGKEHEIPSIDCLPVSAALGLVEARRDGDGLAAVSVMSSVLEASCPGITSEMTLAELNALVGAWQAGGPSVGESPASSD